MAALEIELDIRKSGRANAAAYFDRAKKLREKAARIRKMLAKPAAKPAAKTAKPREKAEWFEKYRHFVSSEGNLVIGGRDAATNEEIVKRHTGAQDTVFHTDIAGSPFVVVRGKCGEATLAEAAIFCASYSRAWQARHAATDAYCVAPGQVSKKAPPGEYLPKGAFMIYGMKRYFRNTLLELAIFLSGGRPAAAPTSAVPAGTKRVLIIPGDGKREAVAKEIKEILGFEGSADRVDSLLPPGKCAVKGNG